MYISSTKMYISTGEMYYSYLAESQQLKYASLLMIISCFGTNELPYTLFGDTPCLDTLTHIQVGDLRIRNIK